MSETLEEKYNRTRNWYNAAKTLLVGRTITNIGWQEFDDEEYPVTGIVFTTDKGDAFYISQDDEGNGPGAIHVGFTEKRRKELKDMEHYIDILPVGVASVDEYREMWKEMHHLKGKSWNQAGHTELTEVKDEH